MYLERRNLRSLKLNHLTVSREKKYLLDWVLLTKILGDCSFWTRHDIIGHKILFFILPKRSVKRSNPSLPEYSLFLTLDFASDCLDVESAAFISPLAGLLIDKRALHTRGCTSSAPRSATTTPSSHGVRKRARRLFAFGFRINAISSLTRNKAESTAAAHIKLSSSFSWGVYRPHSSPAAASSPWWLP